MLHLLKNRFIIKGNYYGRPYKMKLTSDKSMITKSRRLVTFFIEPYEDTADIAGALTGVFDKACAVVRSPFGEHRMPLEVSGNPSLIRKSLEGISITEIEIGEGSGRSDLIFIIDCKNRDLTCIGPLEYDFYSLLKEHGLEFGI